MTNLYLAEKDMYNRMADNSRGMEQKGLYKLAQSHGAHSSGGMVKTVAMGLAGSFGRVADNVQSWFAGPRVAEQQR